MNSGEKRKAKGKAACFVSTSAVLSRCYDLVSTLLVSPIKHPVLANKAKLFTGTKFNVGKQTDKQAHLSECRKYLNLYKKL